jgi:hypothetical protein
MVIRALRNFTFSSLGCCVCVCVCVREREKHADRASCVLALLSIIPHCLMLCGMFFLSCKVWLLWFILEHYLSIFDFIVLNNELERIWKAVITVCLRKTTQRPVRIANILAETWIKYLSNTNLEHYHCSDLLIEFGWCTHIIFNTAHNISLI